LIKPVLPYPPNQGTRVASFGLIKSLRPHFDVTVLARVISREEILSAHELEQWCARVITVMAPNRKSIAHRIIYKIFYHLKSLALQRSLKSLYDCPGAFLRAARDLSDERFDLVIIEYWQLQRMARYFPPGRCVLLTHDIDMLVNRRIVSLERNLLRKLLAIRRWLVERREEAAAYRGSARIWTLTERDKAAVEKIRRKPGTVDVLPVGVDADVFASSGVRRNQGEVLFLGHLGASFNRDALDYFIREVYPKLGGVERLRVTIVGGELPKHLEFFGHEPGVEVVGSVGDVRPFLHRASCLVIPLRFGGGLRIRILEAMSAGIPVVCSPAAIAGMPFEPGKDLLLADSPDGLADAIKRVLGDESLAAALSASAGRKVRERYATDVQAKRFANLVESLVSSRASEFGRPNGPY
jgi:glycosyltransferase involved in cell wall biosynthesis